MCADGESCTLSGPYFFVLRGKIEMSLEPSLRFVTVLMGECGAERAHIQYEKRAGCPLHVAWRNPNFLEFHGMY